MPATHSYLREHTLQARKLHFNIEEQLERLRALPPDNARAGVALLKESALNVVLTVMKRGTRLSEHEPQGAATIYVLEGSIRVEMDGEGQVVGSGELIAFDADVRREATALEDTALLTTVALEPRRS